MVKPLWSKFFGEIWTQSVFLWLKHIDNKKITVFEKIADFPDFSDFPENSDFGPYLSQISRSGNIFNVSKLNDIASATAYHLLQILRLYQFFSRDMTNFASS